MCFLTELVANEVNGFLNFAVNQKHFTPHMFRQRVDNNKSRVATALYKLGEYKILGTRVHLLSADSYFVVPNP